MSGQEVKPLKDNLQFFLDPKKRKTRKPSIMNYREGERGLYLLAKRQLIEWTDVHSYCHTCLSPLAFHDSYDASYCAECNEWREETCADLECEYCKNRPAKPTDLK